MILKGQIQAKNIGGKMRSAQQLRGRVGVGAGASVEYYAGEYDVIPLNASQELKTKQKFLSDNVRVHPVPYLEVPLQSGGIEVNIGG